MMNRSAILPAVLLIPVIVVGQSFKSLRYQDDLSSLPADSSKTLYEKFKRVRVGKTGNVSPGGEIRYLPQNFFNEDWGDSPDQQYLAFYTRFLFHTDFLLNERFRLFAQLNSTVANGRVTPVRRIDENRLAVHQFFAEARLSKNTIIRFGRQELLYGSQRLISVREGPNNRLNFDAAKLIVQHGKTSVDLFYSAPVDQRTGVWDDEFNQQESLWGVYLVRKELPFGKNIDLYYLGLRRSQVTFDSGIGNEVRHSVGLRWWNKSTQWDYDFEALYQFGVFSMNRISAWTISLHTNYQITNGGKPVWLGVKTEIISGDKNRNDSQLNTFNPLYPRGAYFGLAALIGPANLLDVHPCVKWQVGKNVMLSADLDLFWRHRLTDGIYGPNTAVIYSGENTSERLIGEQFGINAEITLGKHWSIVPEFTWFNAGPYLKEVSSGKDVFFSALTVQFKY